MGGRNHLTAQLFSRPQGGLSLSNLIPNLWSSPTGLVPIRGNASAVTLGARTPTTTDVWVLVETRVQKWTMSSEGWEEAVLDQDIGGLIRPAIHAAFPSAPSDDSSLDLELLDFEFEKRSLTSNSGKMVILVSYAGKEETMAVDMVLPRRVYALVRMSYASGMFRVEYLSTIPYQNASLHQKFHSVFNGLILDIQISISGAPMHPRLQLIHQGALVVIQFGDAVAFCARGQISLHSTPILRACSSIPPRFSISPSIGAQICDRPNSRCRHRGLRKLCINLDRCHDDEGFPRYGSNSPIQSGVSRQQARLEPR